MSLPLYLICALILPTCVVIPAVMQVWSVVRIEKSMSLRVVVAWCGDCGCTMDEADD
jgi:hypothetical protein